MPILERKDSHAQYPWLIPLLPSPDNGLSKLSTADTSQVKSLSRANRFKGFAGHLSPADLAEVYAGIRLCLGLTDSG